MLIRKLLHQRLQELAYFFILIPQSARVLAPFFVHVLQLKHALVPYLLHAWSLFHLSSYEVSEEAYYRQHHYSSSRENQENKRQAIGKALRPAYLIRVYQVQCESCRQGLLLGSLGVLQVQLEVRRASQICRVQENLYMVERNQGLSRLGKGLYQGSPHFFIRKELISDLGKRHQEQRVVYDDVSVEKIGFDEILGGKWIVAIWVHAELHVQELGSLQIYVVVRRQLGNDRLRDRLIVAYFVELDVLVPQLPDRIVIFVGLQHVKGGDWADNVFDITSGVEVLDAIIVVGEGQEILLIELELGRIVQLQI